MAALFLPPTGRMQRTRTIASRCEFTIRSGNFCVCAVFFALVTDLWKLSKPCGIVSLQERVQEPGNWLRHVMAISGAQVMSSAPKPSKSQNLMIRDGKPAQTHFDCLPHSDNDFCNSSTCNGCGDSGCQFAGWAHMLVIASAPTSAPLAVGAMSSSIRTTTRPILCGIGVM